MLYNRHFHSVDAKSWPHFNRANDNNSSRPRVTLMFRHDLWQTLDRYSYFDSIEHELVFLINDDQVVRLPLVVLSHAITSRKTNRSSHSIISLSLALCWFYFGTLGRLWEKSRLYTASRVNIDCIEIFFSPPSRRVDDFSLPDFWWFFFRGWFIFLLLLRTRRLGVIVSFVHMQSWLLTHECCNLIPTLPHNPFGESYLHSFKSSGLEIEEKIFVHYSALFFFRDSFTLQSDIQRRNNTLFSYFHFFF